MTSSNYRKFILGLGLGGTLFAGYLSGVKLFTAECAFSEGCPYFLGYPACYFGFAMFFTMTAIALFAVVTKPKKLWPAKTVLLVSVMGTLFAGYYTLGEVASYLGSSSVDYALILPLCTFGLIFYLSILLLTIWRLRNRENEDFLEHNDVANEVS